MNTEVIAPLLGIVAGVVSGIIAAWVSLRGKRLDHQLERDKLWVTAYEKALFEARLSGHRTLWALTEQTSSRNVQALTPAAAEDLSEAMTRWYYQDGGMLLSADSRNAYFRARTSLAALDEHDIRSVVRAFSDLRTAISDDLNSRAGPTLPRPGTKRDGDDVPEVMFSRRQHYEALAD